LATKAFQAKTATLTGCRFCLRRTKVRVPVQSRLRELEIRIYFSGHAVRFFSLYHD